MIEYTIDIKLIQDSKKESKMWKWSISTKNTKDIYFGYESTNKEAKEKLIKELNKLIN